ncbi:MAG TPA: DUF4159 domain-containing protein [Vicinamibacterales bacterium]|nr:DUF4159 domain-containing protein [Vicinamibacterales bacterium]
MPRHRWLLMIALLVLVPLTALGQRGDPFGFGRSRFGVNPNVRYDGRFNMVRIRYLGNRSWSADYPAMERNLTTMMNELTSVDAIADDNNVYTFDDPELLKYPVIYLTEPGYWYPTDEEVEGLRRFLAKGAFLIVDDFHFENEWAVFENAMRRVLPSGRIEPLTIDHPVFNSFFEIKSLRVPYPGRLGEMGLYGEFYGIHEGNDPARRLMVMINYNMDIGDYMEWSATGTYAMAPTNEAYKFMINYIIYGLTH